MSLTQFRVDDGPHAMDGLRLFAEMELTRSKRS